MASNDVWANYVRAYADFAKLSSRGSMSDSKAMIWANDMVSEERNDPDDKIIRRTERRKKENANFGLI